MPNNTQHIDFMAVLSARHQPVPTARHIRVSWLLTATSLLLVHVYMLTTLQHTQHQHASQWQQLRHIVHAHTPKQEALHSVNNRIIAIAPEPLNREGFTQKLRRLTQTSTPSIWLADAWIDNVSQRIELSGRSNQSVLRPSLLATLRTQFVRMPGARFVQHGTSFPHQEYPFMMVQGATVAYGDNNE